MLTSEQKQLLSKMSVVDIIDFYSVPRILSYIDPLHAIVVFGVDEVLKALERYEKHSPD